MNKEMLVKCISEKASLTKKQAEAALVAFQEVVTEELVAGGKVSLVGFCSFEVVEKEEKTGIIQMGERKGETYVTPAHKAPKVKIGKTLKLAVKG